MSSIMAAGSLWQILKDKVWIVVPVLGVLIALPALIVLQSDVEHCHNVYKAADEFRQCVADDRASNYTFRLLMTGPFAAFLCIIVFFTARGEARARGRSLTSGGLSDAYFVYAAIVASLVPFFIATAVIRPGSPLWPLFLPT